MLNFTIPSWEYIIIFTLLISIYIFLLIKFHKLSFLKHLIILFLIFLFLSPRFIVFDTPEKHKKIAVVYDISGSMDVGNTNRFSRFQNFIESDAFKSIDSKYRLEHFVFSDEIKKTTSESFLKLTKPSNANTDLINALSYFADKTNEFKCVLLLTDARHNAFSELGSTPDALALPVFIILPSESSKDLSIYDVASPLTSFKGTQIFLSCKIKALNYRGKKVRVNLKLNNKLIETKIIKLSNNDFIQDIEFEFKSNKLGNNYFEISIDRLENELTYLNNNYSANIMIRSDKTRVLYLCGRPNWEYKFLREVLVSDPATELVSLNILRNASTINSYAEKELSLIPFPSKEVFEKEIYNFDLIILENFSYLGLFPKSYLANIKKAVTSSGTALLIIAGQNSFTGGGYKNTEMEDILPVKLSFKDEQIIEGLFTPKIIKPIHPIMKLAKDSETNQTIWNLLPELDGFITVKPKDDAAVLAEYPYKIHNYNYPFIVLGQK
ncbi:glutamine amidotransferase, partial [bacterium]